MSEEQITLEPHLNPSTLSGRVSYPSPFFDVSRQYMPPSVKELFKWTSFYFYNSSIIGSISRKMARYPVTDTIYDDDNVAVANHWKHIMDDIIRIKTIQADMNLDVCVYGNALGSVYYPFTRFLVCKECGHQQQIKSAKWKFELERGFRLTDCPKCKKSAFADVKDQAYRSINDVRIIRWCPKNVDIKYHECTGHAEYLYTVPRNTRDAIRRGERELLERVPWVFVEAVKHQKKIRLSKENLFHQKSMTLADDDMGWALPSLMHGLKDIYHFFTMRKSQEMVLNEHINPFDIMFPTSSGGSLDPYLHSDLSNWKNVLENMVAKHRRDPAFKAVVPFPVGHERIGGDGKVLMLNAELEEVNKMIAGAAGTPLEFVFGGLSWSGSSVSLRTLENEFIHMRSESLLFTKWVVDKLRIWMRYPKLSTMKFQDFKMADDIQKQQQAIDLNARDKLSDHTLFSELGYDYQKEQDLKKKEIQDRMELNRLYAKLSAQATGEGQLVAANFNRKLQRDESLNQQEMAQQGLLPGAPGEQPGGGQPGGQPGGPIGGAPGSGMQATTFGGGPRKSMNTNINMNPLPEGRMPTRAGAV